MKILRKKKFKKVSIFYFFRNFLRIFITWTRNPWHGGVYIPYGKSQLQGFEKIYVGRLFSGYLKLGVLGAWMTFKKAEMAKTLKNGLSMIETNPLNHNWSDFVILSGLTLHQFQKKLLLSRLVWELSTNQKQRNEGFSKLPCRSRITYFLI